MAECPPQFPQTTLVRPRKVVVFGRSPNASATAGSVKLGQPVPESNFVLESNRRAPQAAQRYSPDALL